MCGSFIDINADRVLPFRNCVADESGLKYSLLTLRVYETAGENGVKIKSTELDSLQFIQSVLQAMIHNNGVSCRRAVQTRFVHLQTQIIGFLSVLFTSTVVQDSIHALGKPHTCFTPSFRTSRPAFD